MNDLRTLHLFAGAGGGLYADLILGHIPVGAIEKDASCCDRLRQGKAEGWWPQLEVWERDIRGADTDHWKGRVDCIHAGWPCQDISVAGKGAGLEGERSGLWSEVVRFIRSIRPRYALLENSPAITSRGLGVVLGDLAELGYAAPWCVLPASAIGAPQIRARWWCLAYPDSDGCQADHWGGSICDENRQREGAQQGRQLQQSGTVNNSSDDPSLNSERCEKRTKVREGRINDYRICEDVSGARSIRRSAGAGQQGQTEQWRPESTGGPNRTGLEERQGKPSDHGQEQPAFVGADWWSPEPSLVRMVYGVADRVNRIKALGNGQVPLCAAAAWCILQASIEKGPEHNDQA